MSKYAAFLESKVIAAQHRGITNTPRLNPALFQFQKHCVQFGLRAASWGCFLSTGLGKTLIELEWASHARQQSNGYALILTPLAVARQIEAEGRRWGYKNEVRVIREQREAKEGINICNYDRLSLLEPSAFGAIVLDESSIIKNFAGKTTRTLIDAFAGHRWRMAATATPAPNDHMELGTHAELLGVMPLTDMLTRWFIHDSANTSQWRLKGHAVNAFWDWMASWCRMADHPRDMGDSVHGYDLPELRVVRHQADASAIKPEEGTLFATYEVSATEMHALKRQTAESRARTVAGIIGGSKEQCVVWCDTDYEADALRVCLSPIFADRFVEVRGSMSIDAKESALQRFSDGSAQVLVTKSSICGFGLNWQQCNQTVFVGRTFSYEAWYQAIRRFWRFGQKRPVTVHLVVAEGEDSIGRVIERKSEDHIQMKKAMSEAMRRNMGLTSQVNVAYHPTHKGRMPRWISNVSMTRTESTMPCITGTASK